MNTAHVWPGESRRVGNETWLSARVEGLRSGDRILEYKISGDYPFADPLTIDYIALAVLFPAMRDCDACVFHGPVSRSMLENISELNAIWQVWRPGVYRLIDWQADQAIEAVPRADRGEGCVCAFSGGVDACATLLRHATGSLAWRNATIQTAALVHGFDIKHDNYKGFETAEAKARRIVDAFNIPLTVVRTNVRTIPAHWEDSFAANVAAVLHLFNAGLSGGMLASCEPYLNPVLPWGSNPVSNAFLGSKIFPVRTDGAEMNRIDKISLIAASKVASENVRVCWQGSNAGENCGRCEKCVRTQLELAAFGVSTDGNFERKLAPGMIKAVPPKNSFQLVYRQEVLDYARSRGLRFWWMDELERVVAAGIKHDRRLFARLSKTRLGALAKRVRRSLK